VGGGDGLKKAPPGGAPGPCTVSPGALGDRLLRWPACRCGFRPDHPPAVPSGEGLRALATAAAVAALRALQAPGCARSLRGGGGPVEELLVLPPGLEASAEQALAYIGTIGMERVRAALGPGPAPAERDLAALGEAVAGRDWAARDLLDAVRAWVGDAAPGARLRVVATPDGPDRAVRRAEQALAALRAGAERPPGDPAGWEALWSGDAGCWARRVEEAADALWDGRGPRCDPAAAPLARWRREGLEYAAGLRRAFAADLRRWTAQGFCREGLAPVGRVLDASVAARGRGEGAGDAFAFCVDALRADLLEAVLDMAVASLPHLRAAARGVVWAVAPTLTAAQFEAWAASGWTAEIVRLDAGAVEAVAAGGRAALGRAVWAAERRCVCKWDFLDARLHASDDDFGLFAAEFRLRARRLLLPALAALTPGDRAVLFADHGFRLQETPDGGWRYDHGGDTPEEVLVPFCVLEVSR